LVSHTIYNLFIVYLHFEFWSGISMNVYLTVKCCINVKYIYLAVYKHYFTLPVVINIE